MKGDQRALTATEKTGLKTFVETGCTTDRECVAKNVNPLSKCAMGKCQTPCQTDTECNVGRYSYQACVMGSCQDIGCETNEECRIRLSGVSLNKDAVCRAPIIP